MNRGEDDHITAGTSAPGFSERGRRNLRRMEADTSPRDGVHGCGELEAVRAEATVRNTYRLKHLR